jgi:hypothetical protein
MKKYIEETVDGFLLISGDGDYKMMVDYLIQKKKFIKVLCPNLRFASSLYKSAHNLETQYFDYLDKP